SSKVLTGLASAACATVNWRSAGGSRPESRNHRQPAHGPATSPEPENDIAIQAAFERGLAEGRSLGATEARTETAALIEKLCLAIDAIAEMRPRLRREAEGDMVKLAIAVARRVLYRELSIDPESIHGLVKVALDKLQSREVCRVRIHPAQEEAIRTSLARLEPSRRIELTADRNLQFGDVIVETTHGDLDASVESQLREIERGFADRLGNQP
ncbi:MAG: hypothetical protein HYR60_31540, partial [Acidobacteria bacterium]|nr:hypothetical protein [Acidobacteriota bacterium]